jgi:hypothetical protein
VPPMMWLLTGELQPLFLFLMLSIQALELIAHGRWHQCACPRNATKYRAHIQLQPSKSKSACVTPTGFEPATLRYVDWHWSRKRYHCATEPDVYLPKNVVDKSRIKSPAFQQLMLIQEGCRKKRAQNISLYRTGSWQYASPSSVRD